MPFRGRVSFSGGKDPRRELRRVERAVRAGFRDAVQESLLVGESVAKQRLTDMGKIDRGVLRNSVGTEIEETGTTVEGFLFAAAPYSQWVEFGRAGVQRDPTKGNPNAARAAFPPVSAIRGWVARNFRKLVIAGVTKSGRARRPTPRQVDSAAYAIATKIYRFGIKPAPFMLPALKAAQKVFTLARVRDHILRRMSK